MTLIALYVVLAAVPWALVGIFSRDPYHLAGAGIFMGLSLALVALNRPHECCHCHPELRRQLERLRDSEERGDD